ncbi:hypothetical protein ACEWY4_001293 [Coilia grayii]|uniref:Uncharacterized protein n=1 Tax=Coilia grayii TaxID=363190 RepID=A0ABD1KSJ9_9TELE
MCLQMSCEAAGTHGILQLSMDGPAVNWKVYDMLTESIEQETGSKLLNIGSCGLHVMHNAFKAGSAKTKWGVEQTLSSLFWLFKDSPARREDYSKVTGSNVFPKQYCQHRWLENVPVTERAIEIWPHVQKYVASVRAKQLPDPKSKSFSVVAESCDDPLFVTKANIFLSIAKEFQPLLLKYQTDRPVLPFFGQDLFKHMGNKPEWKNLWDLVRKVLLLSHGQASVERGFSVNREIEVENMKERTLVAQRIISDHVSYVGGLTNVSITKELLSASSARQRYRSFLEDEKKQKEDLLRGEKRKALLEEVDELKKTRKRIELNISGLLSSADDQAAKAEQLGQVPLIAQSNAMRKAAKEKEGELNDIQKKLELKLNEIKN